MRRLRPWHLLLVLAALVVPLQAGALDEADAPVSMDVTATLDHCGVADTGIVCKIDVSWSGIEDASSYTATVAGPGGVATEMGTLGAGPAGGSASLWVPYEGNGIYSVTVTAWGEEDEDGNKRKLHTEEAESRLAPDRDRKPEADKPAGETPEQPSEPEQPAPEPEQPAPAPAPEPEEPAEPAPAPAPEPEAPAEPAPEEQAPAAPEPAPDEPATGSAPAEPGPQATGETPAP